MNCSIVYHLLKTFSVIYHVLSAIFLQSMVQKSAAILSIFHISGQCETWYLIFQCIIYDLWAMTASICLTGIIINYHNNLPYVITLNKIFMYLLVIFSYSESSYTGSAITQCLRHSQATTCLLQVTPCATQRATPLNRQMSCYLSPAASKTDLKWHITLFYI